MGYAKDLTLRPRVTHYFDEEVCFRALTSYGLSGDQARDLLRRIILPLGPWQDSWDAWSEVEEEVKTLTPDHFVITLLTQILEVRSALADGDKAHAAEEINDIISVALNWFRNLGMTPAGIADVARSRSHLRYRGQVKDILRRYREGYGI